MWHHVIAILALAALCAAWVLFQRWLRRLDPHGRDLEAGCGSCGRHCEKRERKSATDL